MLDATVVLAHQHRVGTRKKGRGPSHWPLPRSTDYQDPRARRCAGQPRRPLPDPRPALRPQPGRAAPGRRRTTGLPPRQGLRRRPVDADPRTTGDQAGHPPKINRLVQRSCDFALYYERNLVERFFNTIKHFRAIATRYDKLARNFLAAVHFIGAVILLN
jgi:transposase